MALIPQSEFTKLYKLVDWALVWDRFLECTFRCFLRVSTVAIKPRYELHGNLGCQSWPSCFADHRPLDLLEQHAHACASHAGHLSAQLGSLFKITMRVKLDYGEND